MVETLTEYIDIIRNFLDKYPLSQTFLFRGQSNKDWPIASSLERIGLSSILFEKYYTLTDYLKTEINSFGRKFERKCKFPKGYDYDFSDYNRISFNQFPELEYLTYLRHHGFPSPLIDFSKSEYVALFFACEDALFSKNSSNGCVFVFQNQLWEFMGTNMTEIHEIGHYIETDQRHISQQSEYLVACRYNDNAWSFVPFESVDFMQNQCVESNSFLKIEIPASKKINMLKELSKMNINHFTLYRDEDSLMKKLTFDFLQNQKRIL